MAFDFKRLMRGQAEGKAIPYHPALADSGVPTSFYTPGQAKRERGTISQREAKHHIQAYGGNEAIDWVMDCVRLYSDTAGTAEWYLEKNGDRLARYKEDDPVDDLELAPRDLVSLLESPNPFMDYQEFIEVMVINLLLVGNAYWYKYQSVGGKPLAIYPLSPHDVKVIPGDSGVEEYHYQPRGAQKPLKISPEDIVHFKLPNPHNPYYGLGLIKGGGRPFDLELALTDSQAHYFENRADPSMIVQSERRVPRDVFNKLRAQLRARTSGTHNSGELLVLEAGLTATTLTPNARDAMFADLSDKSRDRILALFRVNPKLLGLNEGGGSGDKVQDARREFDNKAMRPFLNKLQTRITMSLVAAWDLDFVIDYAYVMPQEELVKLAGELSVIPGVKVRELRKFLGPVGLSESTGDKEIDEMVLNLPGEELDEDGQGGFPDRALPGEPGRPVERTELTQAFPKDGEPLPEGAQARRGNKSLDPFQRFEDLKALAGEGRTRLPDEERPDDVLLDQRTAEINSIVGELKTELRDAGHYLERGLLDNVEGKSFDPKSLVSRLRNSPAWKKFTANISAALEDAALRAVSASTIQQATLGNQTEDLDYDAIVRSVVYRPDGSKKITQTLKDEVVQKVADALKEEKDREEVEQIVRESIDFWNQTKSETVALTEAVEAYNEGTISVAESLGHDSVIVLDGDEHDEPCVEANGSVWGLEEARANRTEHPRCRRAFFVPTDSEVG